MNLQDLEREQDKEFSYTDFASGLQTPVLAVNEDRFDTEGTLRYKMNQYLHRAYLAGLKRALAIRPSPSLTTLEVLTGWITAIQDEISSLSAPEESKENT